MDRSDLRPSSPNAPVHALQSPIMLFAALAITELIMLNAIAWARGHGGYSDLAFAISWPWIGALALPLLWSAREHRFLNRPSAALQRRPRLAAGLGFALALALLLDRLVSIA